MSTTVEPKTDEKVTGWKSTDRCGGNWAIDWRVGSTWWVATRKFDVFVVTRENKKLMLTLSNVFWRASSAIISHFLCTALGGDELYTALLRRVYPRTVSELLVPFGTDW